MNAVIKSTHTESSPALVIGAGKMGKAYIEKLVSKGISQNEITVVDIDQSKLDAIKKIFPGVRVATEIPNDNFKFACVLSNSPAHLLNLESLSDLEMPPAVLVEKPLISVSQLNSVQQKTEKLLAALSKGYTAYLIDFSPAMTDLLQFMADHGLVVIEGKGNWEKNRTADRRPTAGDLEDEMTHQLASLMALTKMNQNPSNLAVSCKLTYLDYVNSDAQAALAEQDNSIPANPNSATRLDVEINTDVAEAPVLLSMWSSFTSPEQTRVIQVILSTGGRAPEYGAKIIFDDPQAKGDILKIWKYPDKEPTVKVYENPDKLGLQVDAFLRAVSVGENHPALKSLADGLSMVRIAEAALKSDKSRSAFIDIPFEI